MMHNLNFAFDVLRSFVLRLSVATIIHCIVTVTMCQ
jgi:hypothetical protein